MIMRTEDCSVHLSSSPPPLELPVSSCFSYRNLSVFTALCPSDGLSTLEGRFNFTLKNLLSSTIEGSKSMSAAQLRKS